MSTLNCGSPKGAPPRRPPISLLAITAAVLAVVVLSLPTAWAQGTAAPANAAAASANAPVERSLAEWVPADCQLFAELSGADTLRQRLANSDWLRRFAETAFFKNYVRSDPEFSQFASMVRHWPEAFGAPLEQHADKLLGRRVAVALRLPARPDGQAEPIAILLGQAADAELLREFLERRLAIETAEGRDAARRERGGRTVYRSGQQEIAVFGSVWVLCEQPELIDEVIRLSADDGGKPAPGAAPRLGSLAARPEFQQARAAVPTSAAGLAFVDVAGALTRLPAPPAGSAEARLLTLLRGVGPLAAGLSVGPNGAIELESHLLGGAAGEDFHPLLWALAGATVNAAGPAQPGQTPPGQAQPGQAPLGPAQASLEKLARMLPADVVAATAFQADPAAVRRGLELVVPELTEHPQTYLGLEYAFKVYAERFGPNFAVAVRRLPPDSAGGGSSMLNPFSAGLRPPAVALIAQIADPTVMRTVEHQLRLGVSDLNGKLGRLGSGDSAGPAITVSPIRRGGREGMRFNLDRLLTAKGQGFLVGRLQPAIAVLDGHLVVVSHPSLLEAMVDCLDAPAGPPRLADAERFRELLAERADARPGERQTGWSYLSADGLAELLSENRWPLLLASVAEHKLPALEATARFEAGLELLRLADSVRLSRSLSARRITARLTLVPAQK